MNRSLTLGTATALAAAAMSLAIAPAEALALKSGYDPSDMLYGPPDAPVYEDEPEKSRLFVGNGGEIAAFVGLTIAATATGTYAVARLVDRPRVGDDGVPDDADDPGCVPSTIPDGIAGEDPDEVPEA